MPYDKFHSATGAADGVGAGGVGGGGGGVGIGCDAIKQGEARTPSGQKAHVESDGGSRKFFGQTNRACSGSSMQVEPPKLPLLCFPQIVRNKHKFMMGAECIASRLYLMSNWTTK